MSSEHKRPMVAFVMVLVLGLLVLAGVARTEAVRGILDDAARKVAVAGTRLVPQSQEPVAADSRRISQVAVQNLASGNHVRFTRARHRTDDRTGQARHVRRDRTNGRHAAQRHERSTHPRHLPPGHARSWVGPPAHAPAHGLDKRTPPGHAKAKAKGKTKAKGHRKHHHGKGHGKARGHRRH